MIKKTRTAISTAASAAIIVIILVAGVGAYFYFSSTSAPTPTTTTTTTPVTPVTLNLINFQDPAGSWIQWAASQFSQTHPGVTVNVVQQGFGSYIQTEVTAEKTGSSTYDILGFTSTSSHSVLPYLVNLGTSSYDSSDIPGPQINFGGIFQNSTSGQTIVAGLPWDSATFTMFYRTDVFDNTTLSSQFQSQYGVPLDPHSWTSWKYALDADNFLVNQKHIFQYGILTDAQEAHDIIDTFPALWGYNYTTLASQNGWPQGGITNYNIMFNGAAANGKSPLPSFNNSMGVQTLQLYYNLVKYDPQPFGTEINYGLIGTTFASGKAAGAIMFTPENSVLVGANSNVTGKYSVAQFPGGYSETGTDFFGVSKYSQHQQLAEEFVKFLVSPQVNAALFTKVGEFPISKQAVAILNANTTIPQWERTLVSNVFATASTAWANPPNLGPTYTTLIPDFNTPIYTYLQGDGSTASAIAALNQAAAAWVKDVG
ncbi:MAG: extracellular solute-binding protein [Nitrososphaerota archaeon]|nr:extracellular solute-binding protein [Nitrososphaerota archaeon]